MCVKVVLAFPVFEESTVHGAAPSAETSIRYAVTGAPPSYAGGVHESLMRVWPSAAAFRLVGGSGTVGSVVAEATSDGSLVPAALIAETR